MFEKMSQLAAEGSTNDSVRPTCKNLLNNLINNMTNDLINDPTEKVRCSTKFLGTGSSRTVFKLHMIIIGGLTSPDQTYPML